MRITIIGAFDHSDFKGIALSDSCSDYDFFRYILRDGDGFVDILDRYKKRMSVSTPRHTYNNGIVLFNYFFNKGCDTYLINCMSELDDEDMKRINETDIFLVSTVYTGKGDPLVNIDKVVNFLKSMNPQAKIILGGWTLFNKIMYDKKRRNEYYENLKKQGVDVVLVSRMGLDLIWDAINNGFRGVIIDKKEYPPSEPELYSVKNLPVKIQPKHMVITTANGCPFKCNFCAHKTLHNSVTYYDQDYLRKIFDVVTEDRKNKLVHLLFGDDSLNFPYDRMIRICDMISETDANFGWSCFFRIGNVDENMVQHMKRSGCKFVSIGMESGDPDIRKNMNKLYSNEDLENTISLLKKYGIVSIVSLIVGYYGETWDSIENTRKVLERIRPDLVRINIWNPRPDESESEIAKKYGFSCHKSGWSHNTMSVDESYRCAAYLYSNTENVIFSPPLTSVFDTWTWFFSEGMAKEEILKEFRDYYTESLAKNGIAKRFA